MYDALFNDLPPAKRIPRGRFSGQILVMRDGWRRTLAERLWRGKLFTDDRVVNFAGPIPVIPGKVSLQDGELIIDYPQQGLRDRLKPISTVSWLGQIGYRGETIWFRLDVSK